MKSQNNLILILIIVSIAFACSSKKEQATDSNENSSDTTGAQNPTGEQGTFSGEYIVGDGTMYIVPVGNTFEIQDGTGTASDALYFQGKENDTLSVYSNKDRSIIFKMNPAHKTGRYYEPDEQWPVELVGPLLEQEGEEEETTRMMKRRHIEDSVVYAQLGVYDGNYLIETESDGVNATLNLHYNGDQTFNYTWSFEVTGEEVRCNAKRKGVLTMDRTQHGIDVNGECPIHFNFNGYGATGFIVEIDFEDQAKCKDLVGECTFSGLYTSR